ncbi:response regulator [Shewanella sp. GXUN23E]|uniref:response regulator n=1 Tax=Shewanella sp. GXUN23E TaxID=3422498 RepID=UPI003D7E5A59
MTLRQEVIRIGIIDDQALVRQGIASLLSLQPRFVLRWQAGDGGSGLALLAQQPIDVLLLDVRMPGMDGIAVLRALRSNESGYSAQRGSNPESAGNQPCDTPSPGNVTVATKVVMLTTFDEPELFVEAMACGANGFLLKDIDSHRLARAIIEVHAGQTLAEPVLLGQLTKAQLATFADPHISPLNARELSILRLMAAGYTNREIATAVFLAEGTVKNHVSVILAKLNTKDRTRAVLKALSAGLLSD